MNQKRKILLLIIAQPLTVSSANAECVVKALPAYFSSKLSAILVEKGYTVTLHTGDLPQSASEIEYYYLRNVVGEGEYAIYAAGILQGGFEL